MNKLNDAINILLQTIGEQALASTEPIEDIYEAEQASAIIEEVKEELLEEKWSFNSEEWTFYPDLEGYITLPITVLRIDASTNNIGYKDGKLYSKTTKSYKFSAPETVEVTWNIDFDDMPLSAQRYVVAKAARVMYTRFVGASDLLNVLIREEDKAFLNLKDYEEDIGDYNIFDNQTVSRIISRTSNPTGVRG